MPTNGVGPLGFRMATDLWSDLFAKRFFFLREKQRRWRQTAAAMGMGPWRMKLPEEGRNYVSNYLYWPKIDSIEGTIVATQQIVRHENELNRWKHW